MRNIFIMLATAPVVFGFWLGIADAVTSGAIVGGII
jgi:hypothetical protein